jgi:hypothetical protein
MDVEIRRAVRMQGEVWVECDRGKKAGAVRRAGCRCRTMSTEDGSDVVMMMMMMISRRGRRGVDGTDMVQVNPKSFKSRGSMGEKPPREDLI